MVVVILLELVGVDFELFEIKVNVELVLESLYSIVDEILIINNVFG